MSGTSRGIRNNNPGNIRKGVARWQGMASGQPDAAFVTFEGPEWGIRAMAKILLSYEARGLDTIHEIIATWAPPSENDTRAYTSAVAREVGWDPDARIDLRDAAHMIAALKAIVHHENGCQPYPDCTYVKAVQLAGLSVKRPV